MIGVKNTKIRNPYLKWAFGEVILKAQVSEAKIGACENRIGVGLCSPTPSSELYVIVSHHTAQAPQKVPLVVVPVPKALETSR